MKMLAKAAFAAALMSTTAVVMPGAASAATLVVDVAGSQSFAAFGTAGNVVRTYNIGAGSRVTGVSYNVNITAFSPSYLSEAGVAFTGSNTNGAGVFLTPGFDADTAGTQTFTGAANLTDLGLDFTVGTDGILRLEYFESFNDSGINPDAIWNSGNLTFTYTAAAGAVPEPASWALMIAGVGVVGGAMRRCKSKVTTAVAYA